MMFANANLRDFLGIGLVSGFMVALFVLFWKAIPPANEQLIVYMLGQLSGFVAGVVSYHYVMNKTNEKATENTARAFDAIKAAAQAGTTESADAAQDEAPQDAPAKPRQPVPGVYREDQGEVE
jgi:uncharacterized membrane protein